MNYIKRFFFATFLYGLSFCTVADPAEINNLIKGWHKLSFLYLTDHISIIEPVYVSIQHNYESDRILRTDNPIFVNLVADLVRSQTQIDRSDGITLTEMLAFRELLHERPNHEIVFWKNPDLINVYIQPFGKSYEREFLTSGKTISDAIRRLPNFQAKIDKVVQQALEMFGQVPASK